MPSVILWEPHVVVCRAYGELTHTDVHQHSDIAYNDPRFWGISCILLDFSAVTATTISHSDVTILANSDRVHGQLDRPRRMAIVTPPGSIIRTLCEHYQQELADTLLQIVLFDKCSAARGWLSQESNNHEELS